uniref:Uncharacterized protein n=1 Tax=Arundo donax TaxID=35708 RepID=A0A0A9FB07_ARUDO
MSTASSFMSYCKGLRQGQKTSCHSVENSKRHGNHRSYAHCLKKFRPYVRFILLIKWNLR